MSTLSEIGDYLEAAGLGTQGIDLFLGSRPDNPDDVLVVAQYPGNAPTYVQGAHAPSTELPQIQVVARAKKYQDADERIAAAWQALAGIRNTVLSGTKYLSITPNGSPGIIGRDTNNRELIGFNATVEKEPSLVLIS